MKKQVQKKETAFKTKEDEQILVVHRKKLFEKKYIQGIEKVDFDFYQNLIQKNQEFLWRSKIETDPQYKQIIPYIVFNYQDKFFLMQRKSGSSEGRLKDKYSLGIGGHIRKCDIVGKKLFDWAKREFYEEVDYSSSFQIQPLGLLNDDSDSVGKVHIGFVFLLKGDSDKIKIKDEHQSGQLLTLNECEKFYSKMENWSKFVFDFLKANF
ncbi:hypothetical protein KAT08_00905 [Candidatus Babeliales bacterium]|nr:hypothetical protein [Candidatus Babeliales bacterium]